MDDGYDNDQGKEMRHVTDGLDDLAQSRPLHFVEKQGEQNGKRETDQQRIYAQKHGIAHEAVKEHGGKEAVEMLHAHPRTAENTAHGTVILKGNNQTRHGDIAKKNHDDKRRQKHRQKHPVSLRRSQFCNRFSH